MSIPAGGLVWAPNYVDLDELKDYLKITDTDDDAELTVIIGAASRAIDDHCNRQFGKVGVPETRRYTARYDYERYRWVVDIDDLADVAGMVLAVTDVGTIDSYELEPVNALADGLVYTRLAIKSESNAQPTGAPNEVALTAAWGWLTVPVPVTVAGRLQSSRFHARRDSPYGVAGSPDQGSEMRLLSRLDPDVAVSLRRYRRARKVG